MFALSWQNSKKLGVFGLFSGYYFVPCHVEIEGPIWMTKYVFKSSVQVNQWYTIKFTYWAVQHYKHSTTWETAPVIAELTTETDVILG